MRPLGQVASFSIIAVLLSFSAYMWQSISSQLRIIISPKYRHEHRNGKGTSHADNQELAEVLVSIHSLYPIPRICQKNEARQGKAFMVRGMGGCSIILDFFACISTIIAAYRFSVSWILRLRVSAFLLQLAVTVLYILASSVKDVTILSTYFSSS